MLLLLFLIVILAYFCSRSFIYMHIYILIFYNCPVSQTRHIGLLYTHIICALCTAGYAVYFPSFNIYSYVIELTNANKPAKNITLAILNYPVPQTQHIVPIYLELHYFHCTFIYAPIHIFCANNNLCKKIWVLVT